MSTYGDCLTGACGASCPLCANAYEEPSWKTSLDQLAERAKAAIAWGVVSADPEQILDLVADSRALASVDALAESLAAIPEHRNMAARIRRAARREVCS